MAGFSIILITLWLGIVLVSTVGALAFFVISLILFLVKGKAQNGGKSHVRKGFAITFLILGFVALLPLGITAGLIAIEAWR